MARAMAVAAAGAAAVAAGAVAAAVAFGAAVVVAAAARGPRLVRRLRVKAMGRQGQAAMLRRMRVMQPDTLPFFPCRLWRHPPALVTPVLPDHQK